MRRRRASRIEANNRPGETGGGSRASERGKGAPGVSLCARLSRGVQLNELPVLVPLVPRNSRLSLFRFRLSRFPPPPPSSSLPLPAPRAQFRVWSFQNPTTKLSFRMQTFMIEGNSCATFVETRSRSPSLPPQGIFYFRFWSDFLPLRFHLKFYRQWFHLILFHLIFLDGLSTDSIAPVWIAARLAIAFVPVLRCFADNLPRTWHIIVLESIMAYFRVTTVFMFVNIKTNLPYCMKIRSIDRSISIPIALAWQVTREILPVFLPLL